MGDGPICPGCGLPLGDEGGCWECIGESAQEAARVTSRYRLVDVQKLERYRQALEFYADPETYHGCMILVDPPCGGFGDDFGDDHGHPGYDRPMPGALARRVLAKEEVQDG